jgi:hypothetical protein
MSDRFLTRAVLACLLGLVGMSLGCNKSPTGPTPPAGSVSTVPAVSVTGISPAGGLSGGTVRIAGFGFLQGVTVTLDGLPATVTGVTSTAITATTPIHANGTVDVVVTNPGGQSGTLTGGYTFQTFEEFSVTASPSLITSGGKLTMSWVAPRGQGCNGGGDWVALYRVGDPDITGAANGHSDLWFDHLCGATSGTRTLSAPSQPGQYEFRYMVGDNAVARSNPVTVSASASSLIAGGSRP